MILPILDGNNPKLNGNKCAFFQSDDSFYSTIFKNKHSKYLNTDECPFSIIRIVF